MPSTFDWEERQIEMDWQGDHTLLPPATGPEPPDTSPTYVYHYCKNCKDHTKRDVGKPCPCGEENNENKDKV